MGGGYVNEMGVYEVGVGKDEVEEVDEIIEEDGNDDGKDEEAEVKTDDDDDDDDDGVFEEVIELEDEERKIGNGFDIGNGLDGEGVEIWVVEKAGENSNVDWDVEVKLFELLGTSWLMMDN